MTFSREYYENCYKTIISMAPYVKRYSLPELLMCDKERLGDIIDDVVQNVPAVTKLGNVTVTVQRQVIIENIVEINNYGHSTVLMDNLERYTPGANRGLELLARDREKCVTITLDEHMIQVFEDVTHISYDGNEYKCLRVVDTVPDGQAYKSDMFFIPVHDTSRLFCYPTSDSCFRCPHKKLCVTRHKTHCEIPDYLNPEKMLEVVQPVCLLKHSSCRAGLKIWSIINLISYYYEEYINALSKVPLEGPAKSRSRHKSNDSVVDELSVSVVDYDGSEIIVPLRKYARTPSAYQGGHHASPKAHLVSEYTRRRSKNDPTLITIKGFARGGTQEQREKLKQSDLTKQRVYSME